ncbi:protein IQ-DOMAIN 14-like [Leguminivora glycinivorella]|uniref:protein IQ-DOMAIN 14-like n=1 Tax=Leguminivora glycinivorella TaxID=1035111 RepID=UPI00200E7ADD|nr:protein IQ-DOMAIN 14-like [Leguminivora glycinivorella]
MLTLVYWACQKPPLQEPASGSPEPRPDVTSTPNTSTAPREVPFRPPPCSHQDRDRILADGPGKAGSLHAPPTQATRARDMINRLKGYFRGEDVELRPEDHEAIRTAEANPESRLAKAIALLGKPPAPAKQPPSFLEILQSVGPPPYIAPIRKKEDATEQPATPTLEAAATTPPGPDSAPAAATAPAAPRPAVVPTARQPPPQASEDTVVAPAHPEPPNHALLCSDYHGGMYLLYLVGNYMYPEVVC